MASKKTTTKKVEATTSESNPFTEPTAEFGEFSAEMAAVQAQERRERIATAIAAGLASSEHHTALRTGDFDRFAADALHATDALIAALDRTKGS